MLQCPMQLVLYDVCQFLELEICFAYICYMKRIAMTESINIWKVHSNKPRVVGISNASLTKPVNHI